MKKKFSFLLVVICLIASEALCTQYSSYKQNNQRSWRPELDPSGPYSGSNTPGAFVRNVIKENTDLNKGTSHQGQFADPGPREGWQPFYDGIYNRYRN